MKEPRWLTRELILAVHEDLLARYGGLAGVRDDGLLESALHRPLHLFSDAKPSLFQMAAAYPAGIIKNHSFLDGNKRAGFMAAYVFLEANGRTFSAPEEEVVIRTRALAAGRIGERAYVAWLKDSCRRGAAS